METFSDFTNLYPLSKTLRFRLIPVGKTLRHFIDSGILEEDQHRAEGYVKVKAIIDDYHRSYIVFKSVEQPKTIRNIQV